MIKGITFDLDGVYFPDGAQKFVDALVAQGADESEVRRVFFKADEMHGKYKTGGWSDQEYWHWVADELGLDMTPQELISLLIQGYTVDEDVAETVRKARVAGYQTLICTNNFPARMNGLQKKFGFLDDFDVVVSSHEVGTLKPRKEIFEALVKASGLAPNEIVFADDNPDSLAGAQEVGMVTFVYENFKQFMHELKKLGVNI